jgi:hypothetical protein
MNQKCPHGSPDLTEKIKMLADTARMRIRVALPRTRAVAPVAPMVRKGIRIANCSGSDDFIGESAFFTKLNRP